MTVPLISLLMPTRGRPALVKRFFRSVSDESSHLEAVEIILYVDEDDVASQHLDSPEVRVVRIIGPRLSMGEYNSRCLGKANGQIVVLVNDDMVIRTHGWDDQIRALDAAIADKIYLAYSNDLLKGDKLCTFPILSRRTCNLLVDPYPAAYRGAFIDYHLLDIFKRLQHAGFDRIRYLEDVVFEHLHYRTGKAEFDETYSKRGRFADDPDFIALVEPRRAAAQRLHCAVAGKPLPAAVPFVPEAGSIPHGLSAAVVYFTRRFLFDTDLPLRWRGFLWYWFIGRWMAAQGMLRPFVK